MEKNISTEEICRNKLRDLGVAMRSLIDGKTITLDQILLISEATDKQKNLALLMHAASTLEGKEYTTYCRNIRKILKK